MYSSLNTRHSIIQLQITKQARLNALSFRRGRSKSLRHHPYLSAGWTEAVLICAYAMPAETADLVAAGTREEVDVINLQRLHTQRALHGVFLQLRATGHLIAQWYGGDHGNSPERDPTNLETKQETQRGQSLGTGV